MRHALLLGFAVLASLTSSSAAFAAPAEECERLSQLLSMDTSSPDTPSVRSLECYQTLISEVFVKLYPSYEGATEIPVCETELWNSLKFLPSVSKRHRFEPLDPSVPAVEILITSSELPNAFALPSDEEALNSSAQIILSLGLVRLLSDRNELAFVLAHEMSHIMKDHFPILPPFVLTEAQLEHIQNVHRSWEFEADRAASTLLAQHGMNVDAPVRVLERLTQAEAKVSHVDTSEAKESHPSAGERIAALRQDSNGA